MLRTQSESVSKIGRYDGQLSPINSTRVPPHNQAAEQALLGAILLNNSAYEKVGDFLLPEHFYVPAHARIFEAIARLIARSHAADAITLKVYFRDDTDLVSVGGGDYLDELVAQVVTVVNIQDYAWAIHDCHLRRQLILLGDEITDRGYNLSLDKPAAEQLESAEQKLYEIASKGGVSSGFVPLEGVMRSAVEIANQAYLRGNNISGITTGLVDLDRKLGGLHRSDLVILAGRPSMGKTALATNIAFMAARAHSDNSDQQRSVVGFFSLEMSAQQLATRLLAQESRVSSFKIRRGEIGEDELRAFATAAGRLNQVPLFIDDTPDPTVSTLRTRARRLKRSYGLELIVIDYLQLLRPSAGNSRAEFRVQELTEITRNLKALAKELEVPVLALSQLSRGVESREDKRPLLSDLRESGSIEQDADVVMFVFREQYYLERAKPLMRADESPERFQERLARWQEKMQQVENLAEVIIAKQRHGPVGEVTLHFDGEFTCFSDLDPHH